MSDLFKGFTSFFRAFGFIFRHRLAGWYLVPLLLWIIMVVWLTISISGLLQPVIEGWLDTLLGKAAPAGTGGKWDTVRGWLTTGLQFTAAVAIKIMLWYILGRITKYVILILCSPLLAYLSEKTEEIITGKSYPFSLAQLLHDAWRGVLITLRNLFLELGLMILGFIVSFFIPVLAPLVTVALFGFNCYFMGFSLYDYVAERRKLGMGASVQLMRSRKWELAGMGLAFNLMSMIYVLDWVVAPINGAVGAAMAMEEKASAGQAEVLKR
ncbi:MAG: EI24 domain-containing protein [Bacteroidetes bacterium]|nr:EI24 domain-containing protein [Bacteroidota bacterium]